MSCTRQPWLVVLPSLGPHATMTRGRRRSSSSTSSSTSSEFFSSHLLQLVLLVLALGLGPVPVSSVHFDELTNHIYPTSSNSHKVDYGHGHNNKLKVFYQTGDSDDDLPVCSPRSVCAKIDTYGTPWVEKQCRCPQGARPCSTSSHARDGFSIVDRTRQYKTCEPVRKLKRCKFFKDVTWSLVSYPDNSTQQIMHCRCPKNSVAYLIKRSAFQTEKGTGFHYSFACSPQTKIRCKRKEPCRLFSVRKDQSRLKADEVNMSTLCQCPRKKKCPKHHLDVGVIPGKTYTEDSVRTYSGYCM